MSCLTFFVYLVAQKNEKEEAAKQRALTEAIRSEQRNEELNGFHRTKRPGMFLSSTMFSILYLFYSKDVTPVEDDLEVESEIDDDEPLTVRVMICWKNLY